MRIAIPVFGSRVSPRFDCAQAFLLVTADEGNRLQQQQLAATDWAPHERINRLRELGVDAVICGGIDWRSAESLRSAGIVVCNSITGDVDEALDALLRGGLLRPRDAPTCAGADLPPGGESDRAGAVRPDDVRPQPPRQGTTRRQRRRGGSGRRGT